MRQVAQLNTMRQKPLTITKLKVHFSQKFSCSSTTVLWLVIGRISFCCLRSSLSSYGSDSSDYRCIKGIDARSCIALHAKQENRLK